MNLSNTVRFNSLKWVKEELRLLLKEIERHFELYLQGETEGNTDRLIEIRTVIRQIKGTLSLVEVYGAAMLGEELDAVIAALQNEAVTHKTDAHELVLKTVLQFSNYLDNVATSGQDTPIVLLPLINDLRSVRKEKLLSESSVFAPDVTASSGGFVEVPVGDISRPDIQAIAKKLRSQYQRGLLGWFLGREAPESLKKMQSVLEQLRSAARCEASSRLWWVSSGLAESLFQDGVEISITVKLLMGQIDRQIALLAKMGEVDFAKQVPTEVIKNILYYIARSKAKGDITEHVKQEFRLTEFLPLTDQASDLGAGLSDELLDTVSKAIKEDIHRARDILDMHGADQNLDELKLLPELMNKVGDTLNMLGLGNVREKINSAADAIEQEIAKGECSQDSMMRVANVLLSGEDVLNAFVAKRSVDVLKAGGDTVAGDVEHEKIVAVLVKESLKEMARVKEAIREYLDDASKIEKMQQVPELLASVKGAMFVDSISQAKPLIEQLSHYIEQEVLGAKRLPSESEQESMADLVTSIEYYLEASVEDMNGEPYIAVGEKALTQLSKQHKPTMPQAELSTESKPSDESRDTVQSFGQVGHVNAPVENHKTSVSDETFSIVSDDVDKEILEIFIEECSEALDQISELFPQWKDDLNNEDIVKIIRRAFHTLKGSGRLIGAELIGQFAWAVENMLNHVFDGSIAVSVAVVDVVEEAVAVLPLLIEQIKGNRDSVESVYGVIERAMCIAEEGGAAVSARSAASFSAPQTSDAIDKDKPTDTHANLVDGDVSTAQEPDVLVDPGEDQRTAAQLPELDPVLLEIFTQEVSTHIETIESQIQTQTNASSPLFETIESQIQTQTNASSPLYTNDELIRALHSLHGTSRTAELHLIADVASRLESYGNNQAELQAPWSDISIVLLTEAMKKFKQIIACLTGDKSTSVPDMEELLKRIDIQAEISETLVKQKEQQKEQKIDVDPKDELVDIFLEEAETLLDSCDEIMHQWQESGCSLDVLESLQRHLHTIKGSARMAELAAMADLSHAIEEVVLRIQEGKLNAVDSVIEALCTAMDRLTAMRQEVLEEKTLTTANELIHSLHHLNEDHESKEEKDLPAISKVDADSASAPAVTTMAAQTDQKKTVVEGTAQPVDLNDDLIEVFLEEGEEIINACDHLLDEWETSNYDPSHMQALQRHLHTLKGGARMADLTPLGDLSHLLEEVIVDMENGKLKTTPALVKVLKSTTDTLADLLTQIREKGVLGSVDQAMEVLSQARSGVVGMQTDVKATLIEETIANESDLQLPELIESVPPSTDVALEETDKIVLEPAEPLSTAIAGGEQLRVRADQLDYLINNAGEVSVYHSRIERQLNEFNFHISELEHTIVRIRSQVREITIETDAQIESKVQRQRDLQEHDEAFDPLEMDRYSNMQQLAHSLMESVNDLDELREAIGMSVDESEALLHQQKRIGTELQEGLMGTRMVRFDGVTARLRRLVRQTAQQLDKKAKVVFSGGSNEIDRSVQDRMLAPLEHMLRNAVSHGIESPQERVRLGKPEEGTIEIDIGRDGSYVLISLTDDGGGIDVAKIRQKAIDQGLLAEDTEISDHEVMQYILHTGFSTVDEVTQISGRGVGMDVVNNEIKHLGGSLKINSELGRGTTFTVRLPLTLAINQALLVEVKEDIYAIPLAAIEGVARVAGSELKQQYNNHDKPALYHYNEYDYETFYLPSLLRVMTSPDIRDNDQYPLLLVRVGERRVAVHVDVLIGRREIVVKPVGRQVSTLAGVSGATILANGRVALILEVGSLVQSEYIQIALTPSSKSEELSQSSEAAPKTVMVVDDSITIRKVSARFLKRNNYHVVTAKDGMDAVAQLAEVKPDIVLLDIEMPRMDGYEVATHIRADNELKDLPIIMITSRTGAKHRERAMQIGVNQYLGKPFQEQQLLDEMAALLK